MDQAEGLRMLASRKTKAFEMQLSNAQETMMIEEVCQALDRYGFQAAIIATDAAKQLFSAQKQDHLFTRESSKTLSAANVQVLFYIRTAGEKKQLRQDVPLLLFTVADKEALLANYQFVKQEMPRSVLLLGLSQGDSEKAKRAAYNMAHTITTFLEKRTTILGVIENGSREAYVDSIYESVSVLVKEFLLQW
ncbi:hypothetical protein J1TS1_14310 [Shouchella clausii]|uniref:Uncharacterized protein n=1 Tax=Shouchella clausii TaxID=79880 RepID=A0A268P330_SHOCL|nr:hypothetical protein [Shouchella clausii]MDO7267231.1 hypothetical protein [Shouchella clausii]MDO7287815.1 hypothetical protein [Shouchella clausii]PAE90143.1 hypothetical protein CHH72_03950 [Shouchella clausii]PAE95101.1 hypothetical protein CHH70_06020 [Shouchella clausii]GIN07286.1 hypothetical protein J1TS1_14310 [Shouchella clausii]